MKIFDISQSIPDCAVYPGDPVPQTTRMCSIDNGDLYNLTFLSMCAHNGTHVDAPNHFIKNGKSIDGISLDKTVGMAYVVNCSDTIDGLRAAEIINTIKNASNDTINKLIVKGRAVIDVEGAKALADAGIVLVGSETQSIGDEKAPMAVHKILLEKEVVLLEGVRLDAVSEGIYFLVAAPLLIAGADGAPCRALLLDLENNI